MDKTTQYGKQSAPIKRFDKIIKNRKLYKMREDKNTKSRKLEHKNTKIKIHVATISSEL